ncbi:MAG: YraN family protein [Armatimonadota bacterium]|nr:YraN family protein [Armatimonadota bacterium]
MPTPRSRIGRSAEIAAAAELGKRGYRIIASNYRRKTGEIDFIAEEDGQLVFIEVRCKRTGAFGSPAESITPAKQARLAATAQCYLDEHDVKEVECRFDIVEVVQNDEGGLLVKDIIRDAFCA